ncbi:MAG: hypothetical protein AAF334_03305 [Pseudomonadota bacterium]
MIRLAVSGTLRAIGPFSLTLPDGWHADFADGVHEMLPETGAFAMHVSGYEKETPVTMDDLIGFAADEDAEAAAKALPSGLMAVTFDTTDADQSLRYWLIASERAMIFVTLTAPAEEFEASVIPAEMVVATIAARAEAS